MTEQREHPRFAIELDATIVSEHGSVPGRTRDLSKGGFCMLTREPIVVGLVCQVRLALVFSENQFSEHLQLPATVVWCTPLSGMHQIGIKLGPLDAQTRGYLDMFVKFLEGSDEDGDDDDDDPDGQDSGE